MTGGGDNYAILSVTIIRHGQTDGNVQRLLQGRTDTPLNATGRQQATKCGEWLKDRDFDLVFASTLSRAFQTASIIVENNTKLAGDPESVIRKEPLLQERNMGPFENTPFDEWDKAAAAAGIDSFDFHPEGVETVEEEDARVDTFFKNLYEEVCQRSEDEDSCRVLVVTHGGLIYKMALHFERLGKIRDLPQTDKQNASPKNTGITQLELKLNRSTNQLESGTCTLYYSTKHLD